MRETYQDFPKRTPREVDADSDRKMFENWQLDRATAEESRARRERVLSGDVSNDPNYRRDSYISPRKSDI